MKRDDDYIRQLLVEFEGQPDWLIVIAEHLSMSPEDRSRQYHTLLLCDAGLVAPVGRSTYRLTAGGHDYLDAIRNEGIWAKTKEIVAETGGSATLEIIKSLALGLLKKKVSQHTGIEL